MQFSKDGVPGERRQQEPHVQRAKWYDPGTTRERGGRKEVPRQARRDRSCVHQEHLVTPGARAEPDLCLTLVSTTNTHSPVLTTSLARLWARRKGSRTSLPSTRPALGESVVLKGLVTLDLPGAAGLPSLLLTASSQQHLTSMGNCWCPDALCRGLHGSPHFILTLTPLWPRGRLQNRE